MAKMTSGEADALTAALAEIARLDAVVTEATTYGGPPVIKGLSAEEWTDAAVKSLTDESLKSMTRTVAALFKTLKDEAIHRGLWEELSMKKIAPQSPKI